MKKAFVLIVVVSWVLAVPAANTVPPDTLAARMWRQVMAFPQEKLYAQTDRSDYTYGDTIWVRHHIAFDLLVGLYTFRAYTRYMATTTPEYVFECPVRMLSSVYNPVRIVAGLFATMFYKVIML